MSHISDQKRFKTDFKAKEYLKNYYNKADLKMIEKYVVQKSPASETMRIMVFMDTVCNSLLKSFYKNKKPVLLELGGGPTIYQLMNIIDNVKEVHFSDYTDDNLNEIRSWKNNDLQAFDWEPFLKVALMIKKDSVEVSDHEINDLKKVLQKKITKIINCDIFNEQLGVDKKFYDVINTHFVADSATKSKSQWKKAINNIYRKLNNNGLLFMSALLGAKNSYKVLENEFPAVELYEKDISSTFSDIGFSIIHLSSIHTEDKSNNYDGFMFIVAQKITIEGV